MLQLVMSEEFAAELDSYDRPLQQQVVNKLKLLAENPTHQSLNIHRIKAQEEKWEFYINMSYRGIYERVGDELRLWKLGPHSLVDTIGRRAFSPHTTFRRFVLGPEAEVEPTAAPTPTYIEPEQVEGSPNRFRDLPATHLRILGVPAPLVKPLQKAPTAEAALALTGLPEHVIDRLEQLLTDSSLEQLIFDEGRLLYRTTLDRLEGYCTGSIKQLMLNLTPEQQPYVASSRHGTTVLRGVAGSGKTTIGIHRAITRAEVGRRVLMLTFSRTLNAVTRGLIESQIGPLPENLEVVNIDKWVADLLSGRAGSPAPLEEADCLPLLQAALEEARQRGDEAVLGQRVEFFRDEIARVIKGGSLTTLTQYLAVPRYGRQSALGPEQRRAVWRVYESYERQLKAAGRCDWRDPVRHALDLLTQEPLTEPYDDVIVDEGQDLTAAQLRLVQRLIKGRELATDRTLLILGDAAQTIYSRGFAWRQAGIQARGNTFTLKVNHRNTRQIAEAAFHLLAQNQRLKSTEEFIPPEATRRLGNRPRIITCTVPDRELRAVRERILDLVSDGRFRISDFAVLAPTRELCEALRNDLTAAHLPAALHSEEAFDLLEEQVKILTIHSAKGLEFPVVLVAGVREGLLPYRPSARLEVEERDLELERQRTLLYVAMTRAAEALFLVTAEATESFFLKEIADLVDREPFH